MPPPRTHSPAPVYLAGQNALIPSDAHITLTVYPVSQPPDDGVTVLVLLADDDEPSWLGYRTDDEWHSVDGGPFAGQVVGWMHTPSRDDVRFTSHGSATSTPGATHGTPAHHAV